MSNDDDLTDAAEDQDSSNQNLESVVDDNFVIKEFSMNGDSVTTAAVNNASLYAATSSHFVESRSQDLLSSANAGPCELTPQQGQQAPPQSIVLSKEEKGTSSSGIHTLEEITMAPETHLDLGMVSDAATADDAFTEACTTSELASVLPDLLTEKMSASEQDSTCGEVGRPSSQVADDRPEPLLAAKSLVEVEPDDSFGDFDEAPASPFVPVSDALSSAVQELQDTKVKALSTVEPDDSFGEFDQAPKCSTEPVVAGDTTYACPTDDIGDVDPAPASENTCEIKQLEAGLPDAGDFAAQATSVDDQQLKSMRGVVEPGDMFGELDLAPPSNLEPVVVGPMTEIHPADDFGDFSLAPVSEIINETKQTHSHLPDGDFGDFDSAPTDDENLPLQSMPGVVPPTPSTHDDDDFDDFGDFSEAVDNTDSTQLQTSAAKDDRLVHFGKISAPTFPMPVLDFVDPLIDRCKIVFEQVFSPDAETNDEEEIAREEVTNDAKELKDILISESDESEGVSLEFTIEKLKSLCSAIKILETSAPTMIFDQSVGHPYSHFSRPLQPWLLIRATEKNEKRLDLSKQSDLPHLIESESVSGPVLEPIEGIVAAQEDVVSTTASSVAPNLKLDFTSFEAPLEKEGSGNGAESRGVSTAAELFLQQIPDLSFMLSSKLDLFKK